MSTSPQKTIAVLGGTGKEGKGLAYRWAKAGHPILIGSRSAEKASSAAQEILALLHGKGSVQGLLNQQAAEKGEVLVLTVPYPAHRETLEGLREYITGKPIIDVTVPLVPPRVTRVQMPAAGSAALEARQILGETAEVASAFQNISHELLLQDLPVDCDVLVCGTSKTIREQTLELVAAAGLQGWDAGVLENSMVVEGFTSILIGINKQYGITSAGIRITGVNRLK